MKSHLPSTLIVATTALGLLGLSTSHAIPYTQATVTRLENKVSYGTQQGTTSTTRPAEVTDVVKANTFLLSEGQSRAELQYVDGTIVRVGQNTLFSFSASSRTLALSKGVFYFYVPKGSGGATIKTPSIAAAITGTVGKVTINSIVILDGSIRLIPSRRTVSAGQFARKNRDGSITIDYFDKRWAPRGVVSADGAAVRKSLERDVLTLTKYSAKNPPKPLPKKPVAKSPNIFAKNAAHDAANDAAHTASRDATRTATTTAAKQASAAAAAAAAKDAAKQASKSASKNASKEAAKPSVPPPHPSYSPHP